MFLVVVGTHLIGDVVDWSGQKVEIVHEHRCGEHHVEHHRTALKRVVGVCGKHVHRLLHSLLDVRVLRLCIDIESVVHISSARGVVAVGCDDVLALLEIAFGNVGELCCLALKPCLTRAYHKVAIDVELEHIIV